MNVACIFSKRGTNENRYKDFGTFKREEMPYADYQVKGFYLIGTNSNIVRALDKKECLVIIRDNFCQFCTKTYVVTPHPNRLDETVQMRGHNICFQ